jgi:hypothetical protein
MRTTYGTIQQYCSVGLGIGPDGQGALLRVPIL